MTYFDHEGNVCPIPNGDRIGLSRRYDSRIHRPFGLNTARDGSSVVQLLTRCGYRGLELIVLGDGESVTCEECNE